MEGATHQHSQVMAHPQLCERSPAIPGVRKLFPEVHPRLHPLTSLLRGPQQHRWTVEVGEGVRDTDVQWLEGSKQPFLVWTYHRNPEYIRAVKRLNPRQARWALFFARFQVTVSYKPGSKNVKADALSRLYDVGRGNPHYPSARIIAPLVWDMNVDIWQARHREPATTPENRAYVPTGVRDCQHLGIRARPGTLRWTSGFGALRRPGVLHTLVSSGPCVDTINWPTATALRRLFFLQVTWSGSPPSACPAGS